MKKISIVIPVYNEEYYIQGLLESLSHINYHKDDYEMIVVSDASTDGTVAVVKRFPSVRLVELSKNVGRYYARKAGAEAAIFQNILFVDSRCAVDPNILLVLNQLNAKVVVGNVLGVEKPGSFETFYRSIRRKVFPKYYNDSSQILELNIKNFDSLPKGTAVFFVEKMLLLEAYEELNNVDMGNDSSDDIRMIYTIVKRTVAIIHPDVKVTNYYRKSFRSSVIHLFRRGSPFVDYYLSLTKKKFWYVIVFPLVVLIIFLLWLIFSHISFLLKTTFLMILDVIVALYLSNKLRDFLINMYMLPLCVLVFYLGIIRGLIIKFKRSLQK